MAKEKIQIEGFDLPIDVGELFFWKCHPKEITKTREVNFGSAEKKLVEEADVAAAYGKEIEEDLHLFFDEEVMHKASFFKEFSAKMQKEWGFVELDQLIGVLRRSDKLVKLVIWYYLRTEQDPEEVLKELLMEKKIQLPAKIQKGLVNLILFPEEVKDKLINEIKMAGEYIKKIHEEHQSFIEEQRQYNTIENVQFMDLKLEEWYRCHEKIKVRFSCMNPKVIWWNNYPNYGRLILGTDYESMLKSIWNVDISFPVVAAAMGDDLRYQIIELIKTMGEISIKDISNMLHMPVATVVYHMEKLKEARLLRFRMQGKTALYSLNPASFYQAIQEMQKLIAEGK